MMSAAHLKLEKLSALIQTLKSEIKDPQAITKANEGIKNYNKNIYKPDSHHSKGTSDSKDEDDIAKNLQQAALTCFADSLTELYTLLLKAKDSIENPRLWGAMNFYKKEKLADIDKLAAAALTLANNIKNPTAEITRLKAIAEFEKAVIDTYTFKHLNDSFGIYLAKMLGKILLIILISALVAALCVGVCSMIGAIVGGITGGPAGAGVGAAAGALIGLKAAIDFWFVAFLTGLTLGYFTILKDTPTENAIRQIADSGRQYDYAYKFNYTTFVTHNQMIEPIESFKAADDDILYGSCCLTPIM